MSAAVAYAPNRYSRVQMNTASLNYAPTKGWVCSSLKGVPLHCIIFRTATDPAVGSGSLLLKFAKILGKDNIRNGFFGQEINITTYNLCRINMFLHDIGYDKFSIEHGDTLTDPKHWDEEPFEAIVSNPPYSIKWEGSDNGTLINDPRFSPAGVLAPKSKADFAFIMHCLHWLATDGTAAIVCFPGIMYRGGAEQKIRKYLIDNNYIECIIQLPDNLFYGTSIATCIMVLKKSKIDNQTLFIDASKEFIKSTNSNKLGDGTASNEPNNIQNILNAYINRKTEKHFTALVKQEDIENADYNLSVSTGTDLDKILPPISRFSGGSNRALKKQTVIEKLKDFFEKYFGLI